VTIEEYKAKNAVRAERLMREAAEKLELDIVRYRAWLDVNGACCGHPKGAIVRYGVNRLCRVCSHKWGTFAETDGGYVPGDAP
jgi:uncharacterized protein YuzB (UPF0349 family)